MTRYLAFLIFGSILGFFIFLTAPLNAFWLDAAGLLLLSIGTGMYLSNIKIAGLLSSLGLALNMHVMCAWWLNFSEIELIESSGYLWSAIVIYLGLTLSALTLVSLGIYSVFKDDQFNNRLDRIILKSRPKKFLKALPVLIMVFIFLLSHFYFNRPY